MPTAATQFSPNGAYGPLRRKEDARFIRGRGTLVNDIQLPGMLHGAILRSPLAHARITGIDTLAAEAHPKVRAVWTTATTRPFPASPPPCNPQPPRQPRAPNPPSGRAGLHAFHGIAPISHDTSVSLLGNFALPGNKARVGQCG